MLALAYSDGTLDIYGDAVCYMFYRFFEQGTGMIWVRICLPENFDDKQIIDIFKSLKMDQQRSFDYWSARSDLHEFAISRYFRNLNSDLNFWRSKSLKHNLIPNYQMRGSLKPVIVYNEPLLFHRSADYHLERVQRNWNLTCLFASCLRKVLVDDSGVGYDIE